MSSTDREDRKRVKRGNNERVFVNKPISEEIRVCSMHKGSWLKDVLSATSAATGHDLVVDGVAEASELFEIHGYYVKPSSSCSVGNSPFFTWLVDIYRRVHVIHQLMDLVISN